MSQRIESESGNSRIVFDSPDSTIVRCVVALYKTLELFLGGKTYWEDHDITGIVFGGSLNCCKLAHVSFCVFCSSLLWDDCLWSHAINLRRRLRFALIKNTTYSVRLNDRVNWLPSECCISGIALCGIITMIGSSTHVSYTKTRV